MVLSPAILFAQLDSTLSTAIVQRDSEDVEHHEPPDIGLTSEAHIHPVRFGIVTGGVVGTIAGIHIYQANGWWKNNRAPFHFQEDLKYGLSVDKLGHFYGGTVAAFILRKSYQWAGLSEESALYWGSAGSLLFQTYVEIEDGFSKWGFDRVDFASDVLGAAWPVAQYHSPFLRNFDFKFSYYPSPDLNSAAGAGFQGQKHIMFDDYEGQTLWLTMKLKNLLPASAADWWPDFLCFSVGYAARDVFSANPRSAWLLALDLDMTKVIPDDTPFLKLLGEALNFIKFPMPAVQLTPKVIWYGFYF